MRIRPATAEDTPHIVKLGRQLLELHTVFDFDYYQLEPDFDVQFAQWVHQQLSTPYQFIFVSEEENGGQPVISGFISGFMKALYPWFKTKNVGHISYLIINPAYRKKGVGKSLENMANAWFKEKNVRYVELYVEEKNPIGKRAWESYGYMPFKKFLRKMI
ncbi:GNAT family N-acetyltransferase [Patescibacteria group bacterium]|nr:GNAT family N-acetyltransferase [Patescibacteria group bacterium]MCL5797813.1 GNAT family N-acetyltransferase [Patescibacteria group bacterium]